ncbi:hypothetical protein [Paenibacillus elgii]|uniref:hypothetical protein n=1 Tax=Paenibacillus elgii TaxID=189691 RepID=UPI001ED95FE4|nr:hypothetical protein [Paenibacillus elgii]
MNEIDTSVEYVLMSQRATELQEIWNPQDGDFFTTTSSYCGGCNTNRMCKDCARMTNKYVVSGRYDYHKSIGGTHWFFFGHACVRGYGNFADSTASYVFTKDGKSGIYDRFTCSSQEEMVWLPRQDQLQEISWNGLSNQEKIRRFIEYLDIEENYSIHNDSLESLWLSLYMKEKHNKKWNRISNINEWEEIG